MSRLKTNLLFTCCLVFFTVHGNPLAHIDSLLSKLNEAKPDSIRAAYMLDISFSYNRMGVAKDEALNYAEEALKIANKNKYYKYEVSAYTDMAKYYELKSNKEGELDCYLKALDICEKQNYNGTRAAMYNLLGNFFRVTMKNAEKALGYVMKELEISREYKLVKNEADAYANAGNIYYDKNDFNQALKYYLSAFHLMDSLKQIDDAATMTNNIGSVYTGLKEYEKAIEYYQKSLIIYQELQDTDGTATALANIGNVYNMKGDAQQGIQYSLQALPLSRKTNDKELVAAIYIYLAEGYSKMGDFEKAFVNESHLADIKDSIFDDVNTKQVNDMVVKYDTEKKDRENKILELSVNRQKIISYAITTGLLLVILLVFFVFRSYMNKKKAHEELESKNKIIEEKNKDILDSINYAKTIQNAILSPNDYIQEVLGEHFIVYKPRDVVSGDFYWCHANEDKVIFTVADCTGHGVPGAFMSVIGNSLLNEVVIEKKITDAAEILNNLRTNLLKTLQQKGQNAIKRDGMDIALCVWDKSKNTIQYAGANNPLYLLRKEMNGAFEGNSKIKLYGSHLAEFLPDKQPIGYYESKTENPFTSQYIKIEKDDIIYVSSDGYADQFGGENGKKYTRKKFRETLDSLSDKNLEEQKQKLNEIIENWRGAEAQTDDICLMGVKFS